MDKITRCIPNYLTTKARIVALIYKDNHNIVALKMSNKYTSNVIELHKLSDADLVKQLPIDSDVLNFEYDSINLVVEFLNNATNCKACQQGNGCGALFFNELAKPTRNLFTITQVKEVGNDYSRFAIDEIITIGVKKTIYWLSIGLLYALPLLFCIITPFILIKSFALQVNDLLLLCLITLLLTIYYSFVYKRFKHTSFSLFIDTSEQNMPKTQNITQL